MIHISRHSWRRAAAFVVLSGACAIPSPVRAQQTVMPLPVDKLRVFPFPSNDTSIRSGTAWLFPVRPQSIRGLSGKAEELDVAFTPKLYISQFPIFNVSASTIAYWLAPTQYQNPLQPKNSQLSAIEENILGQFPRLPGNANGPLGVKLPAGITSIEPVDPQNALIVTGTKEGIAALTALLPTLDVAFVQYEIEAQVYRFSLADFPALGLNFGEQPEQSPDFLGSVSSVPSDFQAKATHLIVQERAKLLTAPRVTAIDGLTAQLQQSTSIPLVVNEGQAPQKKAGESPSPKEPWTVYVTTATGLRVTPVQRKDNMVSLAVSPILGTLALSVVTTVRDGQSFAIQMSPAKDERQMVVVVTTRRVRRLPDDAAVIGKA